jgi:transcription initiation factor TFIIB
MTSEFNSRCPECQSLLIHDHCKGEHICPGCGYVVMEQGLDYGPESHSFDSEEKTKNARASGYTSVSLHDYGLRTEIGLGSRDYSGKSINHQIAEQMNSMRKWHSRIRVASPKERRLSNVLSKINEICSIMSLSKTVMETAAMLYRNYETMSEAKGKSIACIAAASIYLACKRCSIVRSLDEIVRAEGIQENDRSTLKLASKYYRMMVIEMGVFTTRDSSDDDSTPSIPSPSQSPQPVYHHTPIPVSLSIDQYIAKLTNMAKIDTKVERLAIDLAHKTNSNLIADGKAPNGLAAAYIYLASLLLGINLLQMDISTLAGVTEVTIRNRCKDIMSSCKIKVIINPAAGITIPEV